MAFGAAVAGAQLFGFIGLLLAVPIAGAIKTIFVVLFRKHHRQDLSDKPIVL